MPIYEYICMKCRKRFEKLRPVNFRDRPLECPACSGPTQKLPSVPALQDNLGTKLRRKLDAKKGADNE